MVSTADTNAAVEKRAVTYAVWTGGLLIAFGLSVKSRWLGTGELHTLMELAAMTLAILVGVLALVRYYTRKNNTILFVGAGFFGTGLLDGYHALVTSSFFASYFPSGLASLIPWSWVASRLFLSVLMVLAWLAWRREQRLGKEGRIREGLVYLSVAVLTMASFLFFAFHPLPRAYYPEYMFHRPEEFVPAAFFLIALAGFVNKGTWRRDTFEHYLVISLVIGVIGQAVFMSLSGKLFDAMFDAAHLLKVLSYLIVLTGLIINMAQLFRRGEESAREIAAKAHELADRESRLRAIVNTVIDAIITIDEKGTIQSVNPATERMFGYGPGDLIGKNVSSLAEEPHRADHDTYLSNYMTTGEAKIIGKARELEARRRSGETFPIELGVVEVVLDEERLFVGVIRDITERKEADRVKSEFISTVSHELRTPLTSIRGSLGLVQGGAVGKLEASVGEMIELAVNNTDRLINLVNDLLDMEKIESGNMKFRFEKLDLGEVVRRAVEANQGYAEQFGVQFVVETADEEVLVWGDSERLTQVIANLLSNAAKFSPEGDAIDIRVSGKGGVARVEVEDHGPGMRDEVHQFIFQKFYQADSSDARIRGGTGLGLSITKTIVSKHGGTIDFLTSTKEGHSGTTMFFELPILGETAATGAEPPPKPALARKRPAPAETGEPARILVCEDDPDAARLIAFMLEQEGYATDIAESAEAAKALLRQNRYDLMTVDVMLPDQDGISLIRDISIDEATKNLPFVVVSVKATETREEVETAVLGITDWLDKPIDRDRLLEVVSRNVDSGRGRASRILYVEDDDDLVEVVRVLLRGTADVVAAGSLKEARDLLSKEDFELVILDIGLPDGSGLTLLPSLKPEDSRSIPVIIFSGDEIGPEVASEVEAALVKSRTSDDQLLATVRSLLANG